MASGAEVKSASDCVAGAVAGQVAENKLSIPTSTWPNHLTPRTALSITAGPGGGPADRLRRGAAALGRLAPHRRRPGGLGGAGVEGRFGAAEMGQGCVPPFFPRPPNYSPPFLPRPSNYSPPLLPTHPLPRNPSPQTDNNINELMERVSIGGSKVVQGAGKAVKLLGKLLGGGGDKGAQDAPSAPSAARSSSLGSMALPSATSAALPGGCDADEGGGCWDHGQHARLATLCDECARCAIPCRRNAMTPHSPAPCLPASPAPPCPQADEDASMAGERERGEGSVGAIVALLAPPDGSVWVAHASGTVDRYTPAGRRLGTEECGANITAAACVGRRVWLGFSDGMLRWVCWLGGVVGFFEE